MRSSSLSTITLGSLLLKVKCVLSPISTCYMNASEYGIWYCYTASIPDASELVCVLLHCVTSAKLWRSIWGCILRTVATSRAVTVAWPWVFLASNGSGHFLGARSHRHIDVWTGVLRSPNVWCVSNSTQQREKENEKKTVTKKEINGSGSRT